MLLKMLTELILSAAPARSRGRFKKSWWNLDGTTFQIQFLGSIFALPIKFIWSQIWCEVPQCGLALSLSTVKSSVQILVVAKQLWSAESGPLILS